MPLSITPGSPPQLPIQPGTEATKQAGKPGGPIATPAEARTQLNASIIQASLDVSINAKNEPLTLLLKSAINGINDLLKPEFGENAIQAAASQDNTPEGTAGRIVSLSTGFFEAFKKQHAGENEADVLKKFMDTIRSGFEQGYKEASNILQGLGVLNGNIADSISKTYELVQKGYADFEAAQSKAMANPPSQDSPLSSANVAK